MSALVTHADRARIFDAGFQAKPFGPDKLVETILASARRLTRKKSPISLRISQHVSIEPTPDDLRDMENAASKITIKGARYPEHVEQMSNR